jgi:hypothetical protein
MMQRHEVPPIENGTAKQPVNMVKPVNHSVSLIDLTGLTGLTGFSDLRSYAYEQSISLRQWVCADELFNAPIRSFDL